MLVNNQEQGKQQEPFDIQIVNSEDSSYLLQHQYKYNKYFSFIRNKTDFLRKQSRNILSIIFIIIFHLNYLSLDLNCPFNTDQNCLKGYIMVNLNQWILQILLNSIIFLYQVLNIVKKKGYLPLNIFALIHSLYFIFFWDNTVTLVHYNGVVNLCHVLFCIIFTLFACFFICCRKIYKKYKNKFLLAFLFLTILSSSLFYFLQIHNSCDYWTKGINGQIENQEGKCIINTPDTCWYKIMNRWADLSFFLPSCKNSNQNKDDLLAYLSEFSLQQRYIGFNSLKDLEEDERVDKRIQNNTFRLAQQYENLDEAQKNHEIILDTQDLKYHIQVKRNETLANERMEIFESKNNVQLAKNVLLIVADAIGRQSMHLKLPNTVKFFQKYAQQNSYKQEVRNKQQKKQSEAYEFYRFQSFKPYTYDNLMNLYFGKVERYQQNQTKLEPIVEDFKKQGYISAFSSDFCQQAAYFQNIYTNMVYKTQRRDYEMFPFSCDPSYQDPQSSFSLFKGPFSIFRRCLYGKAMAEYPLEYMKSFMKAYKNEPKFMNLEFQYGHEGSGEVINYLDEYLSNFLEFAEKEKYLEDTVIIFCSDHGFHMKGFYYLLGFQNIKLESYLPGVFIYLPEKLNEKQGDNLAQNQQNLVTFFNVHHFLQQILYGNDYEFANKSLFSDLSNQNSCQVVEISEEDCFCYDNRQIFFYK